VIKHLAKPEVNWKIVFTSGQGDRNPDAKRSVLGGGGAIGVDNHLQGIVPFRQAYARMITKVSQRQWIKMSTRIHEEAFYLG